MTYTQKGFTLIGIIVATSLISLVVVDLISQQQRLERAQFHQQYYDTGMDLAMEGLDLVRGIRDANYSPSQLSDVNDTWDNGLYEGIHPVDFEIDLEQGFPDPGDATSTSQYETTCDENTRDKSCQLLRIEDQNGGNNTAQYALDANTSGNDIITTPFQAHRYVEITDISNDENAQVLRVDSHVTIATREQETDYTISRKLYNYYATPPDDPFDNIQDPDSEDIIIVVDTSHISGSNTLQLPIHGDYDIEVDWGYEQNNTQVTNSYTSNPGLGSGQPIEHTYPPEDEEYFIRVKGDAEKLGKQNPLPGEEGIVAYSSFGQLGITEISYLLEGSPHVVSMPNQMPDTVESLDYFAYKAEDFNAGNLSNWSDGLQNVTSMENMFYEAQNFDQDLSSWDTRSVENMHGMFNGAIRFNGAVGDWDTTNVTDMSRMFRSTRAFNQPIGEWDVSNVTNMNRMFNGAKAFNQPIEEWDVSSVTDMAHMFNIGRGGSFHQPLNGWGDKTGNVENMQGMFYGRHRYNRPLGDWDVSSVTNMSQMFSWNYSFNQDLGDWDVGNVTNMRQMFRLTRQFNNGGSDSIKDWDVSSVTDMDGMFYGTSNVVHRFNQPLTNWQPQSLQQAHRMFKNAVNFNQDLNAWGPHLGNVENTSRMFVNAREFNSDLDQWDVGGVTNMSQMFRGARDFNGDVTTWQTGEVRNMSSMFQGARFFNQDIGGWNVSNVNSVNAMFAGAVRFNQDLGGWNVSNVNSVNAMFAGAVRFNQDLDTWQFTSLYHADGMFDKATQFNGDVSGWDLSGVIEVHNMFRDAQDFNQPLDSWSPHMSNVTKMSGMFKGAQSFNQDIGNWQVGNAENMIGMFENATSFNQDIGGWDVSSAERMDRMFANTQNFNQDLASWDVGSVTNMTSMFEQSQNFNQDISGWEVGQVTEASDFLREANSFTIDSWSPFYPECEDDKC